MKTRIPSALTYLLPGLGDILWIGAFFGALGLGPRLMNIDGDLGRHLTVGRFILSEGRIPLKDVFSHTLTGQPVTPHEWLAQVIFALSDRLLGLDGVVLVSALVIATTFWIVFRRARQESQALLPAVLAVLLAIAASSLHWLTRPHLFTFLLLALWMVVLRDLRAGRLRRWWLLPALMVLWANLHGAFIAGFVTWFIYGLGLAWDAAWHRFLKGEGLHGHFWRYYLLGGVTAFLATLINPSGIGLWKTSIGYVSNRYLVSHTMEYLPPNFHDLSTWPFLIFAGLLVVLLGLKNKRLEAGLLFTSSAWLVMALYSVRNVPLFVIVAAPLLSQGIEDLLRFNPHKLRILNRLQNLDARLLAVDLSLNGLFWPVVCLAVAVVGFRAGMRFDFDRRGNTFSPQTFPVAAVDWLEQNPQPGEMFNYFTWGGYLLYRQWPEKRVFIDGQTDFYGEEFTREYEQVISMAEGWEAVLERYQVDWAIVPPGGTARSLQSQLGWEPVYEDKTAVVLKRP